MERVQGNMFMVVYEDTGSKAWDEPRDRDDPCPGKPQQKCTQAVTQMRVFDPTHPFSSLSPSPFNPVDLAVLGHFSYYSLWGKNREGRCLLQ